MRWETGVSHAAQLIHELREERAEAVAVAHWADLRYQLLDALLAGDLSAEVETPLYHRPAPGVIGSARRSAADMAYEHLAASDDVWARTLTVLVHAAQGADVKAEARALLASACDEFANVQTGSAQ